MKIEFPCPVALDEMSPIENGSFCTHCSREVINTDGMSTEEVKKLARNNSGLCVSSSSSQVLDLSYSIRKFALSVLIIFGSSLFKFADAQLKKEIDSVQNELTQEVSIGRIQVILVDQHGDVIETRGEVQIELPNGKLLNPERTEDHTFWVEMPAYVKNKTIVITAEYMGRRKTRTLVVSGLGEAIAEEISFKVKKSEIYFRTWGCPSF
ncbi:MAG: hypothetical protein H6599_07970 [Flavobacteriales bacterium]|nr:hypothetical protein [Flavobacteriales bacterium]